MALGVWLAILALALALALLPGRAVRLAEAVARRDGPRRALPVMLGAAGVDAAVAIASAILSLSIAATWPGVFQLVKVSAAALVLAPAWRILFPRREGPAPTIQEHNLAGAGALERARDVFAIAMLVAIGPLASDADQPALPQVFEIAAAAIAGALAAAAMTVRVSASGKLARLVRASRRPAALVIVLVLLFVLVSTWGR